MTPQIIFPITVDTRKYAYTLKPNGERDIDVNNYTTEPLEFRFDVNALGLIVLRNGPDAIHVDDKVMYFDYRRNRLSAIHFENSSYIWMINNMEGFLKLCTEAYASGIICLKLHDMLIQDPGMMKDVKTNLNNLLHTEEEDIPDEFDANLDPFAQEE